VRDNKSGAYYRALLYACRHELRFDRQCEESRAPFLWQLIQLSSNKESYRRGILKTIQDLKAGKEELVNVDQLYELAAFFIKEGAADLRAELYSAFDRIGFNRAGGQAAATLVELDGLPALGFVCKTFNEVESVWRPSCFDSLIEALPQEERSGPFPSNVVPYFNEWELWVAESATRPREANASYAEIKSIIQEKRRRFRNLFWAKRATEVELAEVVKDFMDESDPDLLLAYLFLFVRVPFPGDPARIITLARSEDEELSRVAIRVLRHLAHPKLRKIALGLMKRSDLQSEAVELLILNGGVQDYPLIERVLRGSVDEDDVHAMGMGVLKFVEAHPSPFAGPSLLDLYERNPCSLCRRSTVRALTRNLLIPEHLLTLIEEDIYAKAQDL
jgi:hypothetical protein